MLTPHYYRDAGVPHLGRIDLDRVASHVPDSDMRDLETELQHTLASYYDNQGHPIDGLFNLTRQMDTDEDDQFNVDLTILDFLLYKSLDSIFEWRRRANPFGSDLQSALLTMTIDWRTILKHKYQGRRLDGPSAFRSRLLQFVLIFTHRLNHNQTWTNQGTLNQLREQSLQRGEYWQQYTKKPPAVQQPFNTLNEFPLTDATLLNNRTKFASSLDIPVDRRRCVTDVAGTPSLHTLLPLFVELSAARVNLDDDWLPTKDWYTLAGEFMLQAVIEEYLRNGAQDELAFNTAFAYGCPAVDGEVGDMVAMRTLFCKDNKTHEQNHEWTRIKRQYEHELYPRDSSRSFLQAMEQAQEKYPYVTFDEHLLTFLKHLHDGLVKPDLIQVEEGCININGQELSEAESQEMIRRMRL